MSRRLNESPGNHSERDATGKLAAFEAVFQPEQSLSVSFADHVHLLVGQLSYGILESYTRTLLAIITSLVAELILGRLYLGKWPNLSSAYISGISVGILLRSPAFWPYALCALISVMSKYVLRVHNRHIWNPSNFGISVLFVLASGTVAGLSIQWGNFVWPMLVIWVLGSAAIIYRLQRFHISATYVGFVPGLRLSAQLDHGQSLAGRNFSDYRASISCFIFFMVTDPKTTVRSRTGQCVVVFLVASVEMLLRLHQVVYAPFYALFLVGPTAMLVEMWMDSRRERLLVAHA